MQIAAETAMPQSLHSAAHSDSSVSTPQSSFSAYKLSRRNGVVLSSGRARISVAVPKALPAEKAGQGAASARIHQLARVPRTGTYAAIQLHFIDGRVCGPLGLLRLTELIGSACGRSGAKFRAPGLAPAAEWLVPVWAGSTRCSFNF